MKQNQKFKNDRLYFRRGFLLYRNFLKLFVIPECPNHRPPTNHSENSQNNATRGLCSKACQGCTRAIKLATPQSNNTSAILMHKTHCCQFPKALSKTAGNAFPPSISFKTCNDKALQKPTDHVNSSAHTRERLAHGYALMCGSDLLRWRLNRKDTSLQGWAQSKKLGSSRRP